MTATLLASEDVPLSPARGSAVVRPLPLSRHRSWQPVEAVVDEPPQYAQAALALSYSLPPEPADARSATPPGQPCAAAPVPDVPPDSHTSPNQEPTSEAWAATFVQAVIEVIASDRPLTQLVRWTSRSVYGDIARRRLLVARHRKITDSRACRQQVATVHIGRPSPRSVEVAARVTLGARSRAVAARLDYVNDRWLCTAICFG